MEDRGEIEFRVLGPFEVRDGGRVLALGGGKQRALLAVLLLHAGEVVSTDRLIDAVWGERPPASALNSVHVYVSQLRKALRDGHLVTRGRGYTLELGSGQLDRERFEGLLAEGRSQLSEGDPARAAETLREALGLWRGPALADLVYEPFAQTEIARLEELRLSALEERIEADLELGRHAEVVPELEALTSEHPHRERPRAQLMLALYRCGRQADALAVYRQGRRVLQDELGLEPGPDLQQLERAILSQDPALSARPITGRRTSRPGALLLAGGGLLLLVVVALVAAELSRSGGGGLAGIAPNSLGEIDLGNNRLTAQVPVGVGPGALAVADGSVWVANSVDATVSRIDVHSHTLRRTISFGGTPVAVAAAGAGAVWVVTAQGDLYRIDPRFDTASRVASLAEQGALYADTLAGVATAFGAVWVVDGLGVVHRVSRRGRVTATVDVGQGASGVATGAGALWVANRYDGTVSRIDPAGSTTRIPVGHGPVGVAVGAGAVWVAVSLDDRLVRIDPETNAVVATIPVGHSPTAVAVARGSVWVGVRQGGTLLRVDPHSNRVAGSVRLGGSPAGLAASGDSLWISTVSLAPAADANAGGVLRVEAADDPGPLDPAFPVTPTSVQLAYLTCAKLVNYLDRPAPSGSRLVPEVAQSAPLRSADGLRYTFVVSPGFRFSPPSNEPVTAQTFKDAFERTFDRRFEPPNAPDMSDVVGVDAYRAGKASHIAGVVARGDTLTFRLKRPSGDLADRLSSVSFCAVPRGAPAGSRPIVLAAAGPYYVSSYTPGQKLVLLRNPNYGGRRPHRPREIHVLLGVSQEQALADVEAGRADYAMAGVPLRADHSLRRRYGAPTAAARQGRQRYFVHPVLGLRTLVLNTSRPLFSDPQLRRAVAYAIDRRALAAQERRFFAFGAVGGGAATDAYLPVGVPGAPAPGAYPLHGPDVARARSLVGGRRGLTAVLYTCNRPPCTQQSAIIRANLRAVGIDVDVHQFSKPVMYARANQPRAGYDILTVGWFADYADPGNLVGTMLYGGSEADGWGSNFAHFDDPVFTPRLRRASALSGAARYRAFGQLARELASRSSPLIAYESDESRDFFSARVGCQVYQPVYGMDLGTLCLRSS